MRTGINIASFGPMGVLRPELAAEVAGLHGYNFVSLLPLRGVGLPSLWSINLPAVLYWESAWNPSRWGIWELPLRRWKQNPKAPKLVDIFAFPPGDRCRKMDDVWLQVPEITYITHSMNEYRQSVRKRGADRTVLEINPGMFLDFEQIVEELYSITENKENQKKPLCLDLNHLREASRPDQGQEGFTMGDWREWLQYLVPLTRLIDFQALDREELEETLNGEATALWLMVKTIKDVAKGMRKEKDPNFGLDWRIKFKPTREDIAFLFPILGRIRMFLLTC